MSTQIKAPSWPALWQAFSRIGLMSFGGPAAQIAVMHRELVEARDWLTEQQFLSALSFCMLLPGPEAMQLATYSGWRLRGVLGGLLAGLLFVVPGAIVMLLLAGAYALWGAVPFAQAAFLGIKATVVIVVLQALLKVSKKALKSRDHWAIAGLAFIAIFALGAPFPLIIALAALYGGWRNLAGAGDPNRAPPAPISPKQTLRTIAIWGALWIAPLILLAALGARDLMEIGMFFSKLAVVTFGGAYAVLAYMTQEVVSQHGWISTATMMDGLGLAETTPGPLILVTEFVGFLAGYGIGGMGTAILAALLVLWVTFCPCFLWIFAGAPYIETLSNKPRLAGALSAITAAVVGVILNLSIWFAIHVFFGRVDPLEIGPLSMIAPLWRSLDLGALALAILAAALLLKARISLPLTLLITGAAGLIAQLAI
ncbi:MAG: chromate efflux transporter [Paracoccaceae bacterium]